MALRTGFRHAYRRIRVDPVTFLNQLRDAHRLPFRAWDDAFLLGPEVLNPVAERLIQSSARTGALGGVGLGLGGFLTIVPDLGILTAITVRLLQKLSLLYGFEYATEQDNVELWMAASSAAGLDLGKEFLEKHAIERLVPRIIDRIAIKVGAELGEKSAARLVPILSAGMGGALNYYFVRAWGRRARKHFEKRHRELTAARIPSIRPLAQSLSIP